VADALASGRVDAAAFPYFEFIPFLVSGKKLRIFRHPAFSDIPNAGYAASWGVLASGFAQLFVVASWARRRSRPSRRC